MYACICHAVVMLAMAQQSNYSCHAGSQQLYTVEHAQRQPAVLHLQQSPVAGAGAVESTGGDDRCCTSPDGWPHTSSAGGSGYEDAVERLDDGSPADEDPEVSTLRQVGTGPEIILVQDPDADVPRTCNWKQLIMSSHTCPRHLSPRAGRRHR